jgi:hypothetical protein
MIIIIIVMIIVIIIAIIIINEIKYCKLIIEWNVFFKIFIFKPTLLKNWLEIFESTYF